MKNFKNDPNYRNVIEKMSAVLQEYNLSANVEIKRITFETPEIFGINCHRVERTRQVKIPGTNPVRYRTITTYETVCD
jgi:hypothetical protein